jgi:hypothetical protein
VPSEQVRDRTRSILEQHPSAVTSASVATLVVQRARAAAARARWAADRLAAVLIEVTSHALAASREAATVADAVYDVLGSGTHRVSPAAKRARCLPRDAAVRGLRLPEAAVARPRAGTRPPPSPGAWVLGRVWRRRRRVFLGLATLVGVSRACLGAHDPGEILAGTRAASRLLSRQRQ